MPYQSVRTSGIGSRGLYEHRNNNGVEPATKRKECTGHHGPFYEILYSVCYQRPESQNCHANTVRMVHLGIWRAC